MLNGICRRHFGLKYEGFYSEFISTAINNGYQLRSVLTALRAVLGAARF